MKNIPLKGKTITYERDYIESEIRWKLKLGDEIFKKSDVKRAVFYLKSEVSKIYKNNDNTQLKKLLSIINDSFADVTLNKRR